MRTFIQVFSLLLTFFSGIMLVRGVFLLSPQAIAKLSGTYLGYNVSLLKSLSQQNADTKVGLGLLTLSIISQMLNLLWPMSWQDFGIDRTGIIYAIIFSLLVFLLSLKVSNLLCKKIEKQSTKIMQEIIK